MGIKCDNIVVVGKTGESNPKTPQPIVMHGVTKEDLRAKALETKRLEEKHSTKIKSAAVTVPTNDKKISQYVLDMYDDNESFSFDKYLDGKLI